jgi:plastocyanin
MPRRRCYANRGRFHPRRVATPSPHSAVAQRVGGASLTPAQHVRCCHPGKFQQGFGAAQIPVLFVPPGVKVTFLNNDTAHRLQPDGTDGLMHEPNNLRPGQTYTQTLTGTGTVPFHCHIHPNMIGEIRVK